MAACTAQARRPGLVFRVHMAELEATTVAEQLENPNATRQALDAVNKRLESISNDMERAKIAEYVDLLNRPLSLMWRNLLGGTARGVGIAIGFTIFAALIVYLLQMLGKLNLPISGDFIADIVRIVQHQLEGRAY